ncbi:zeta toxin family protein [Parapedobacter tibetensis]|uniref:zeta toxin family protein n=1 Tax=Parapedobacter tibetensis TaxID=2972951 RepID=UPI00214DBD72|nr:zeta toxin family protein [Parapedobacter tibetensis]
MLNLPFRLRVFAGPNGSGKSTIINAVRNLVIEGKPIDFGYYVNADDIATMLRKGSFSFEPFALKLDKVDFVNFSFNSGLLDKTTKQTDFTSTFRITEDAFTMIAQDKIEHLAQLLARFLREQLLLNRRRFSFETVFSHPSNLEIMKRAAENGYKVYLYFVSTESAAINKYRVKLRVQQGGHNVPETKIESRYMRSLDLLYNAAELAYQAYFFDNSVDGEPYKLVAHFRQADGEKVWEDFPSDPVPAWFQRYYLDKQR